MKGKCVFCGKEHELPDKYKGITQDQADSEATYECDCEEAVKAKEKIEKRVAFTQKAYDEYGEKYPSVAWMLVVGYGIVMDPETKIKAVSVRTDDMKMVQVRQGNGDAVIEEMPY